MTPNLGAEFMVLACTTSWRHIAPEHFNVRRPSTTFVTPFRYEVPREFAHICWFDTGSHELAATELMRLQRFARTIVSDYVDNHS
jgi:hypothetical protein